MKTMAQRIVAELAEYGVTSDEILPDWVFGGLAERNRKIFRAAVYEGATLEAAGLAHGVSRERVRQICWHVGYKVRRSVRAEQNKDGTGPCDSGV